MIVGAFLVVCGGFGSNRPVEVWSDLRAFSARVASDGAAQHVLAYGGEKEGTDFDYLLKRVWSLSDDWNMVIWAGMFLCGAGILGIILEVAGKRGRVAIEPGRRD
jgi:hypothetical protein